MTITQTVEIPADHRIFLKLPRSVPIGVKARIEINIPAKAMKSQSDSGGDPSKSAKGSEIEYIRQLLHREMYAKGTSAIKAESGDGWEAYIKEKYAEP